MTLKGSIGRCRDLGGLIFLSRPSWPWRIMQLVINLKKFLQRLWQSSWRIYRGDGSGCCAWAGNDRICQLVQLSWTWLALTALNTAKQHLLRLKMGLRQMTIHVCVTVTLSLRRPEDVGKSQTSCQGDPFYHVTTWMSWVYWCGNTIPFLSLHQKGRVTIWCHLVANKDISRSSSKSTDCKHLDECWDLTVTPPNLKCFRDEDLRGGQISLVTQVDLETSFLSEQKSKISRRRTDCARDEKQRYRMRRLWSSRMKYDDAMTLYGSDKPDTRFDMLLQDLTEVVRIVDLKSSQKHLR